MTAQPPHPVIADLIRNPQGGKVTRVNKSNHQHHLSHGQPTTAAHVTACTRNNSYTQTKRRNATRHSMPSPQLALQGTQIDDLHNTLC